ncbi:capsular biosynthesis protein, partial [Campylobacter jejuni]|nr:capsular biosynthesis protein [Campylobacter jejuni]
IFQSFFIKRVIDYFSCINKDFFCNEVRNILTILQENFHTKMTIGARVYYEKFLLNYNFNTFHTQHLKSPKKIALCISGAMRGVEWELNLKKVIESFQFDVDVFLFTWDSKFLWPGLNGAGGNWAKRLLDETLLKSIPREIMHKNNLKQYFPNVFSKLNQEYSVRLDAERLENINNIKRVIIENQEDFLKKYPLDRNNLFINASKIWYSNYQLLKSLVQYEAENNFQYDFIIKVRPDVEYNINFSIDKLEKLYINDLMIKHHESLYGGLNDNFAAGRRGAMEIYLSLWKYGFLNKSIDFFKNFPNFNSAHNLLQQFCSLMKINCICLESNTIKNFYFVDFIPPNFTKELKLDCKRIKNNIELEEKLSSSIDFLLKYEEYSKKGQLYNMVNKSCGHLSYKIGVILIHNSKTFIGILGIPIKILVCLYHHRYRTRHLISKNYYNCHSETIEESFTYRLGKSFIQASRNWYKGGYINFWFDLYKLKKEYKNKKGK